MCVCGRDDGANGEAEATCFINISKETRLPVRCDANFNGCSPHSAPGIWSRIIHLIQPAHACTHMPDASLFLEEHPGRILDPFSLIICRQLVYTNI